MVKQQVNKYQNVFLLVASIEICMQVALSAPAVGSVGTFSGGAKIENNLKRPRMSRLLTFWPPRRRRAGAGRWSRRSKNL